MMSPKLKALGMLIKHLDSMQGKEAPGEMGEVGDSPAEEGSEGPQEMLKELVAGEGAESHPRRFSPKEDKQAKVESMPGEEEPCGPSDAPKVSIEEILRSMGRTHTPASKKGSIELGFVKASGSPIQQMAEAAKKKR